MFLADHEVHFQLQEILRIAAVDIAQILRQNFIKEKTSQCGFDDTGYNFTIRLLLRDADMDFRLQGDFPVFIRQNRFIDTFEVTSFSLQPFAQLRQVVNPQNHILCRNGNRASIGRLQKVIRRQH